MENKEYQLTMEMIRYEQGTAHRIQHFLKVHAFCVLIAQGEQTDQKTIEILRAASLVHDIGIKPSLVKYHSSAGTYQQKEGPLPAREMLQRLSYDPEVIDRVCYLVGHHHTYHDIDGLDYQILVEADFLVNLLEDHAQLKEIESVREKIFKTKTGTTILNEMFLGSNP
jgi:uncharacterized protein